MAKRTSKKGADDNASAESQAPADSETQGTSADTEATAQPSTAANTVAAVRISAKTDRFCRAGYRFGRHERVLRADALTDAQLEQLRREPMLAVVEADVGPDEITG